MEKERRQMTLVGLLVIAIAAAGFWMSLSWPIEASRFPRLVLGLFALLGVLLIIISVKGNVSGKYVINARDLVKPFISLLIILSYVLLIDILGFYVMTTLFLIAYMKYLGTKSWTVVLLTTAGILLFIFLMFTYALGTPLPHGLLY